MLIRFPAFTLPGLVLAFASSGSSAEVRIGAYVGVGFFEASGEATNPGLAYGSKTGLSAGALLSLEVAGQVTLWLEPGYVEKGVGLVFGAGGSSPVPNDRPAKSSLRFSYLELPILARGSLGLLNIEHANSESRGAVRNRGAQLLAGITFGAGD